MSTTPDLTDDEKDELVRLLRDAIANERYFLSPRMKRLKGLLAKLDPASAERAVTPLPPPKPPAHARREGSRAPHIMSRPIGSGHGCEIHRVSRAMVIP